MIIAAKTSDEISHVNNAIKSAFKVKELGPAKFILGMEIDHNMTAGTQMIKQTRYIDDVAKPFGRLWRGTLSRGRQHSLITLVDHHLRKTTSHDQCKRLTIPEYVFGTRCGTSSST